MVPDVSSAGVRSFGRGEPRFQGDMGIEDNHGMAWLAVAESTDFDMPAAKSRKRKQEREPSRLAGRVARLMPTEALRVRGRSEEHTSELQSLMRISYAVFCLKKKN